MRVRFGLHLDGLDPTPPKTAVGEATVGPLGLIGILETDLGLPPVLEYPAEQLVAYRGILDELDTPKRFYHRSFAVDPINVARTLMDWRSSWYEAGWSGMFPQGVGARLKDMADIEKLASERLAPCLGQRVARVLKSLETRRTQIEDLVVCDEVSSLPVIWGELVQMLPYRVANGVAVAVNAAPGTDLATVQTALIGSANEDIGSPQPKTPLVADGSFVVVRSASRDVTARSIAEMIREQNEPTNAVVLAEQDGIIVDNALERSAMPRCGFQHYSQFRAVSQVLKLCLALVWEPVNPHLLLQFLIHPLGPLRRSWRGSLAEAVAAEPGIGGQSWETAVAQLESRLREDEKTTDKEIKDHHASINYWLRSDRFAPLDGAPVSVLTERTQRCANWLASRLSQTKDQGERVMFASAHAQAEALIAALARLGEQGQSNVEKNLLDRLLDEVTRQQPDPTVFAEAGHVRATIHPANVLDTWSQVIWWDLAPLHDELSYPWSSDELDDLHTAGVRLPTSEALLQGRSLNWLRPILNCQDKCILVVHHNEEGQHPLWSRITNLFTGWAEVDLDTTLLEGTHVDVPFLDVPTESLELKPLPAPRRWWELAEDVPIPERLVESYSSLNKLFYYPHEWVLNYAARLRTGRAEDISDDARLYGNLGHRLFETFFTTHTYWRDLDIALISSWIAQELPILIAKEGAVLLEPGRGVDRQRVTAYLERGLTRLVEHLRDAKIVSVRPEHHAQQPYGDVEIGGTIDLVLTDEAGREIVLDSKWGSETYRSSELEHNLHLQLASYAYLRKSETGANQWPYPAYFIITSGNVLAPDDTVFPDALVRAPQEGIDTESLWHSSIKTYRWRRSQLEEGHIEVNVPFTDPTERSLSPDDALDTDVDPDRFDDFRRLTGWDTFA